MTVSKETRLEDTRVTSYSSDVLRLRRRQVQAVVVGVCAGLAWLLGLSLRVMWLAYLGAAGALVAWLAILALGIAAHRRARREA